MLLLLLGLLVSLGLIFSAVCGCCCYDRSRARFLRRSSTATLCTGLITFVLIVTGSSIYWATGRQASDTLKTELQRAADDADAASDTGLQLQDSGMRMLQDLNSLVSSCPAPYQSKAQQFVDTMKPQVESLISEAALFSADVAPLAGELRDVQEKSETVTLVALIGLLVPLGLALLGTAVLVLAVCMSKSGRCTGPFTRCLVPLLLAPTVLIISLAAATQLELGIATSSFCVNVDSNSLSWTEHLRGNKSVSYELGRYYIEGTGSNRLLEELSNASSQLAKAEQSLSDVEQISASCPEWGRYQDMSSALATAQASIRSGQQILSRDNIYPYYDVAIRQDLCSTFIIGLGWLTLFQVLAGIICLPCLICTTATYLKGRAAFNREAAAEPMSPQFRV